MDQNQIAVVGATRFVVGLSQILRVSPSNYQFATAIKIISGGTLEIVQPLFSGTSTVGGSGWGAGYPLGANEILAFDGPATFYFAATGSTVIGGMVLGYTSGATLL